MQASTTTSKLAVFPLCDVDSVLMDALRDNSGKPATSGQSLVLAWRVLLPRSISAAHAAGAVLAVAMAGRTAPWSEQQLVILGELLALTGKDARLAGIKQGSDWWQLVGNRGERPAGSGKSGRQVTGGKRAGTQRKTRSGRVFRDS